MATKKLGISAHLKSLSHKELVEEITKLRKLFPQVREYYRIQLAENGGEELLERAKKSIRNEFLPIRGYGHARLSVARKAVNDFVKLSKDTVHTADLLLYYVEIGVEYTTAYGDIDEPFYTSMENMYEKAARYIIKHKLQNNFLNRLKKTVTGTEDMGWGFNESLEHIFEDCFPNTPLA